jgi:Zn-dependent M16 (insulinase) family peptidase
MPKKNENFSIIRKTYVKELKCHLIELAHVKTNASILYIKNNDDENLFCLSFKTLPSSSNGAPHILEHITLAGSQKFPIKDPFFSMSRRSLNTFMNAMTGQDFTCYPAASQIEKDFYNLLNVYLDAVFHPLLKPAAFLQEGHRLELVDNKLEAKGVVYNEMKGSLNSADSRLFHLIMQHLLPDLPYAYNSGGEPQDILSLTYEQLLNFYKTYYHPSQCTFFFYGNLPLKKHLKIIEKELEKIANIPSPLPPLLKQKRFSCPITTSASYPAREEETKAIISFSFLTCDIENQKDLIALTLLDNILMETDASLLKQALLQSKLCTSASSYLLTEMTEIPWSITLKGCYANDMEKLFSLIINTLRSIKIPKKLVKAALHQLQFNRTEISSLPYGLNLFFRSALLKQQGTDPLNGLCLKSLFKHISQDINNPTFFNNLIDKYIINNPHTLKLTLLPDHTLEKKEIDQENAYLQNVYNKLTPQDIEQLKNQKKELEIYQKELQSAPYDCLPKLSLTDIKKDLKEYPLSIDHQKNISSFHHNSFTNQILYVDLLFDLPKIDNLPLLSLFSSLFFEIGNKKRNYKKNLNYIQAYIGKIYSYLNVYNHINDTQKCQPAFAIRGKCLYKNSKKLFDLIKEQLTSYNFNDKKRIKELLLQHKTHLENNINQNGMQYAISSCLKNLSPSSNILDQFHGLSYYQAINNINLDTDIDKIIDALAHIGEQIIFTTKMDLIITAEEKFYKKLQNDNFYGLSELPIQNNIRTPSFTFTPSFNNEGYIIASPVSYNCMGLNSINYTHEDAPFLTLASHLFDNKILHPKIREEGGAYGSGSIYSPLNETFYFYSYRDPNLYNTNEIFKQAITQIANGNFSNTDLEEAKFQAFQDIDAPILPAKHAIFAYNMQKTGQTYEIRNAFRNKIFSITKEDITRAIISHMQTKNSKTVSLASEPMLQEDFNKFIPPLTIKKI